MLLCYVYEFYQYDAQMIINEIINKYIWNSIFKMINKEIINSANRSHFIKFHVSERYRDIKFIFDT